MPGKIVSNDEWIEARRALLEKEKEHTKLGDEVLKQRAELPMVKVEANYEFTGPDGKKASLGDLFERRRQLVVYHFMFAPGWDKACHGCSYVANNFPRSLGPLNSKDTTLALVSQASVEKLNAWKKRMGWTVPWYSAKGMRFNEDMHKSEDATTQTETSLDDDTSLTGKPGLNVFLRDPEDGSVYLTYATWDRGLESIIETVALLDLTPLGRQNLSMAPAPGDTRYPDEY